MNSTEPQRQCDELNVICPYCQYAYQAESCDYDEQERKTTCGRCDRDFLLYDEITIRHYTRPLP